MQGEQRPNSGVRKWLKGFLSQNWRRVRQRGLGYWVTSAAILLITIWAQPFIDSRLNLADVRNYMFRTLSSSSTNPAIPRHVKLVLIEDDEFWDGALHHRNPTDRAYLARLLRAVDAADASVVALDFDLRLPHPSRDTRPGDYAAVDSFAAYREETDELVRAIGEIAQRRIVVLSKSMRGPIDGPFDLQDDAYQAYGLCTAPRPDGEWFNPGTREFPLSNIARHNIRCGYIALMTDKRRVPPPARLNGLPVRIDSFALAIVRARDPAAATQVENGPYYASYISEGAIRNPRVTISAGEVLRDPARARAVLQGWPAIIGAGWHLRAKGEGELVDLHSTPIGSVHGALVHENLAEAVLSNRTYPSLPDGMVTFLELLIGGIAALLFGMIRWFWFTVLAFAIAMVLLFFIQWLSLQIFGTFVDLFAPVTGLGVHALADRLLSSRE